MPLSTLGMPFFCEGYITDLSAAKTTHQADTPARMCVYGHTLVEMSCLCLLITEALALKSATSWIIAHDAFEDGTYGYR